MTTGFLSDRPKAYCYDNGVRRSVRDVQWAKTVQDRPMDGVNRSRIWMCGQDFDCTIFNPLRPPGNLPKWGGQSCHLNSGQLVADSAKLCIYIFVKSFDDFLLAQRSASSKAKYIAPTIIEEGSTPLVCCPRNQQHSRFEHTAVRLFPRFVGVFVIVVR